MRYVVLHHAGIDSPHFDLLIEQDIDGPLLSWHLDHWPPSITEIARVRPVHRRAYLDFEGDLSGNRGHVKRVAAGMYAWIDSEMVQPRRLCLGEITVRVA